MIRPADPSRLIAGEPQVRRQWKCPGCGRVKVAWMRQDEARALWEALRARPGCWFHVEQ